MNDTKHTPTPYTVQRLNHAAGETWIQIGFLDDGREIGPLCELVGRAVKDLIPAWHPVATFKYLVASDEQVLANAEFIATACNAYDTLRLALWSALAHAEQPPTVETSIQRQGREETLAIIRNALLTSELPCEQVGRTLNEKDEPDYDSPLGNVEWEGLK